MKSILLLIICSLSMSNALSAIILEMGAGRGEVKNENISADFIQMTYNPEKTISFLQGEVGYAYGARASFYKADLFQASTSSSERLEDLDIVSYNVFGEIYYQYHSFKLGFNLDIIGVSNSNSSKIEGTDTEIENETFNLFQGGEADKGSLNSQLFLAYTFDPIVLRLSFSHAVVRFEDKGLSGDDSRQRFFDTVALSLGYIF